MPSVNDTFPSEFVKAGDKDNPGDLVEGDVLTFLDGGSVEESQNYGRDQLIFKVLLPNGDEKKLSVNGSSAKELAEEWGDDTESWEGKKVKASVVKQNVAGKMRLVIYLKPQGAEATPE